MNRKADLIVQNHGSLVLLIPRTEAGRNWVDENIGPDNGFQPYYPEVISEPRYVPAIIGGAGDDGLIVEVEKS